MSRLSSAGQQVLGSAGSMGSGYIPSLEDDGRRSDLGTVDTVSTRDGAPSFRKSTFNYGRKSKTPRHHPTHSILNTRSDTKSLDGRTPRNANPQYSQPSAGFGSNVPNFQRQQQFQSIPNANYMSHMDQRLLGDAYYRASQLSQDRGQLLRNIAIQKMKHEKEIFQKHQVMMQEKMQQAQRAIKKRQKKRKEEKGELNALIDLMQRQGDTIEKLAGDIELQREQDWVHHNRQIEEKITRLEEERQERPYKEYIHEHYMPGYFQYGNGQHPYLKEKYIDPYSEALGDSSDDEEKHILFPYPEGEDIDEAEEMKRRFDDLTDSTTRFKLRLRGEGKQMIKKFKKVPRPTGWHRIRVAVYAVVFPLILKKMLKVRIQTAQQRHENDIMTALKPVLYLARDWILDMDADIWTPIYHPRSEFDFRRIDFRNKQVKPKERESRMNQAYDTLTEILSTVKQGSIRIPKEVLLLMGRITREGTHIPLTYLTKFEAARLIFDQYDATAKIKPETAKMLVAYFIYSRVLIQLIFMAPDQCGFPLDNKKENYQRAVNNCWVLGSILQYLLNEMFNDFLINDRSHQERVQKITHQVIRNKLFDEFVVREPGKPKPKNPIVEGDFEIEAYDGVSNRLFYPDDLELLLGDLDLVNNLKIIIAQSLKIIYSQAFRTYENHQRQSNAKEEYMPIIPKKLALTDDNIDNDPLLSGRGG